MLTVGIFGDSYADPIVHGHDNFREMDELGWPNLLKRKYKVGLHAKVASSIFYSYQQFLENHEKYDKIVFVVTDPIRWVKSYIINGYERHISNYSSAEHWLTIPNLPTETKCILNALKDYYMFLADESSNNVFATLMLNHMKQLRPDIILIPIGRMMVGLNAVSFADYSIAFHGDMPFGVDLTLWGETYCKFLEKNYEYRLICHFSPEMNEVIANDVLTALETGQWNPELPKVIKHPYSSDYYWDKISNLSR